MAIVTKNESPKRLLNVTDVSEMTVLSPSTIRRMELAGRFPMRKRITARRVAWDSIEIEKWIVSRERV
jgi:prophage regulatory protein